MPYSCNTTAKTPFREMLHVMYVIHVAIVRPSKQDLRSLRSTVNQALKTFDQAAALVFRGQSVTCCVACPRRAQPRHPPPSRCAPFLPLYPPTPCVRQNVLFITLLGDFWFSSALSFDALFAIHILISSCDFCDLKMTVVLASSST